MSDGAIQIQGCAIRVAAIDSTGAPIAGANMTWQDNLPLITLDLKPVYENGVDITPVSACGQPVMSYKDYDRPKRWEVGITVGDSNYDRDSLIDGGALLTRASNAGRTFADGATTTGSNLLNSPALASFTGMDYGRAVTGTGIPANTYIVDVISATVARLNNAATATGTGVSITLGSVAAQTIGYQSIPLLTVGNPNGISIEVWAKAILRLTGYQGPATYPSGGVAGPPAIPGSPWVRVAIPRAYQFPGDQKIENKETPHLWTGWAIENPNWGTGPNSDWTTAGAGNVGPVVALDSSRAVNWMRDNALPTPLGPYLQTSAA